MAAARPDGVASTSPEVTATRAEFWLRSLSKLAPRFRCVPMTPDVVAFLGQDGLMLPPAPASHSLPERDPRHEAPAGPDDLVIDSDDEVGGSSAAGSESEVEPPPPLVAFQDAVAAALAEVGPMVLPRLSWLTPWDGAWMNGNEAQCGSVGEVLTVLKASDSVTELLFGPAGDGGAAPTTAGADAPNSHVVLLDFAALDARPGSMFRAFVHRGSVLAVSQLRHTVFLPDATGLRGVAADAAAWIADRVSSTPVVVPGDDVGVSLATYAVDFAATSSGRAHLLDLHPMGLGTDTLLFSQDELATAAERIVGAEAGAAAPEVRVLARDEDSAPGLARRLESVPVPAELAVLMATAAADAGAAPGSDAAAVASLNEAIRMARESGAAE